MLAAALPRLAESSQSLTIRSCVLPFPPPRLPTEVAAAQITSMYRLPWMEGTPSEVPGDDTSKDPVANPAALKTMAKVFGYDVETQGAEEMKYTLDQVAVVATVVRASVGNCDSHARASAVPKLRVLTCNPHACYHRTGSGGGASHIMGTIPTPHRARADPRQPPWEEQGCVELWGQLRHRYQVRC